MVLSSGSSAQAQNLDAGFVLNELSTKEQSAYISGVVEGLAYARFLRDRPNETSMVCVQNWYFGAEDKKAVLAELFQLFEDYKDLPVAVLVNSVAKKECGA